MKNLLIKLTSISALFINIFEKFNILQYSLMSHLILKTVFFFHDQEHLSQHLTGINRNQHYT